MWTLAGVVGVLLVGVAVYGLGLLWDFLDQFDVAPPSSVLEMLANVALGLGMSGPQLVVLRVVLGQSSGAARAWVPVTTLVFAGSYFVDTYWFRDAPPTVGFVVGTVEGAILAIAQGLLLAEMLRMRSATWLWLLGMAIFYGVLIGLGYLSVQMNDWLAGLMFGFAYGATTGVALSLLVWRSARRRLQSEGELLVRL